MKSILSSNLDFEVAASVLQDAPTSNLVQDTST